MAVAFAAPAFAEDAYLRELTLRARQEKLHEDRYWRILLHYAGNPSRSLVDDPRFFISPSGKTDPAAELAADLDAVLQPARSGEEHPRIRFAARYAWLRERLGIDESRLPPADDAGLRKFLEGISPRRAVLVFPSAHGNGPASMFGHTLIRIDGAEESGLVSHAVNYAAQATDTNGFLYAFKGIFGLYPGYYSILPYYEKVKEYGEMERRDVWEYPLNLSPEEVRRMTLHIWELRDISSDYYFFDENCSFNILYLLEAARPTVELTEPFLRRKMNFWVIPVDTVRAVEEAGLVVGVSFRPSEATLLRTASSGLSADTIEASDGMSRGKLDPEMFVRSGLPQRETIRGLELAADLARFRFVGKETTRETYLASYMPILRARSGLGLLEDPPATAKPVPPERGHLPGKATASLGIGEEHSFLDLRLRPSYHDLSDPDAGYVEGSQIVFTEVAGRVLDSGTIRLQTVNLIDILSLAPRERFFSPVSWKVATGVYRRPMRDGREHLLYSLNPGGGFAWRLYPGIAYVMMQTDLTAGHALAKGFAGGIGLSAGITGTVTPQWKVHLAGESMAYGISDPHSEYRVRMTNTFPLGDRHLLSATFSWTRAFGRDFAEGMVGVGRYF